MNKPHPHYDMGTYHISKFVHFCGVPPVVSLGIMLLHKLPVGCPYGEAAQLLLITLIHLVETLEIVHTK